MMDYRADNHTNQFDPGVGHLQLVIEWMQCKTPLVLMANSDNEHLVAFLN